MKFVLATTALAAAILAAAILAASMSFAPALAQEASQPNAPPPGAAGAGSVEGGKPSPLHGAVGAVGAVGAIGTKKFLAPNQGPSDQAGPPLSIPEKTTSVTTIEAPPETAKPMVNIASANVPLPQEVASVARSGNYNTKDLVNAQLMAMNTAPPMKQPVITTTTITYSNDAATPHAPATAGQDDQARTAGGVSGHASDLPAPQPTPG